MASRKRRKVSFILYREREKQFFQDADIPGSYRYNPDDYLFQDVERAAKKYGLNVRYNAPGTSTYRIFGAFNFSILSVDEPEELPKEVLIFNVEELAI